MSIKEQVGEENWKYLFNAMSAASSFVSIASGGGTESIKELFSASKFTQELSQKEGGSGYGELVDEVLESMKNMAMKDAKEMAIKYESKTVEELRNELKILISNAVSASTGLPGEDGFKRWLFEISRKVAETKTGGFLGIGAKSVVDEQEQAAMDELAVLLGL